MDKREEYVIAIIVLIALVVVVAALATNSRYLGIAAAAIGVVAVLYSLYAIHAEISEYEMNRTYSEGFTDAKVGKPHKIRNSVYSGYTASSQDYQANPEPEVDTESTETRADDYSERTSTPSYTPSYSSSYGLSSDQASESESATQETTVQESAVQDQSADNYATRESEGAAENIPDESETPPAPTTKKAPKKGVRPTPKDRKQSR